MKSERWKVHAVFECQDCGERFEDYLNAEQYASRHAAKFKHTVSGELGIAVVYNGRSSGKN